MAVLAEQTWSCLNLNFLSQVKGCICKQQEIVLLQYISFLYLFLGSLVPLGLFWFGLYFSYDNQLPTSCAVGFWLLGKLLPDSLSSSSCSCHNFPPPFLSVQRNWWLTLELTSAPQLPSLSGKGGKTPQWAVSSPDMQLWSTCLSKQSFTVSQLVCYVVM